MHTTKNNLLHNTIIRKYYKKNVFHFFIRNISSKTKQVSFFFCHSWQEQLSGKFSSEKLVSPGFESLWASFSQDFLVRISIAMWQFRMGLLLVHNSKLIKNVMTYHVTHFWLQTYWSWVVHSSTVIKIFAHSNTING